MSVYKRKEESGKESPLKQVVDPRRSISPDPYLTSLAHSLGKATKQTKDGVKTKSDKPAYSNNTTDNELE